MAIISVRLSERLRKEMRKLENVNWSAVVRDAIEFRIKMENRSSGRNWDRVREAAKLTDLIFEKMREEHGHLDYNSAETIRYWRERRYGSTSWTRRSR